MIVDSGCNVYKSTFRFFVYMCVTCIVNNICVYLKSSILNQHYHRCSHRASSLKGVLKENLLLDGTKMRGDQKYIFINISIYINLLLINILLYLYMYCIYYYLENLLIFRNIKKLNYF